MLRYIRDGLDASSTANRAADRIEGATKNVGDMIYQQATKAGRDLAAVAGKTIEDKTVEAGLGVVAGMRHAAAQGAAEVRAAIQGLPAAAQAQRGAILQDWKAALASMAVQEAAQRARRSEWIWGGHCSCDRSPYGLVERMGRVQALADGVAGGESARCRRTVPWGDRIPVGQHERRN